MIINFITNVHLPSLRLFILHMFIYTHSIIIMDTFLLKFPIIHQWLLEFTPINGLYIIIGFFDDPAWVEVQVGLISPQKDLEQNESFMSGPILAMFFFIRIKLNSNFIFFNQLKYWDGNFFTHATIVVFLWHMQKKYRNLLDRNWITMLWMKCTHRLHKWLQFCRQHFQLHFLKLNEAVKLSSKFVCSRSGWHWYINFGSDCMWLGTQQAASHFRNHAYTCPSAMIESPGPQRVKRGLSCSHFEHLVSNVKSI